MRPEELLSLYRTWSDEKLLALHTKSDDHSEAVQMALRKVMAERNLLPRTKNQGIPENGVYMESALLGPDGRTMRTVLFLLATVAGTFWGVMAYSKAPQNGLWILGIVTLLSLALGILFTVRAKAHFSFTREGNGHRFQVQQGAYSFAVEAPFTYWVYYTETQHRYKFITATVPTLGLVITDAYGESVVLQGNLTALDSPPPGWPHVSQVSLPSEARFYSGILLNRVNIEQLKNLLDEAHAISEAP